MGFLELPKVNQIRTPGFVQNADLVLEQNVVCGSFTSSGVNWRMWFIYILQLFFLVLCVAIGATIQNGVGDLGGTYDAVDILRLVGGVPGILAAVLGAVGLYIRMRYLLMSAIILDTIAVVFVFLSWVMDAADATDLANRVANPPTVPAGTTPVNFTNSRDKATTSCIFGVLGWLVTVIAFYLTYATYQEMNGVSSKSPSVKEPKVKETKVKETKVKEPKVTETKVTETKVKEPMTPKQEKVNKTKPQGKPTGGSPSTHHCPQCSTEWPYDVKFCGECGSKIPDVSIDVVTPSNSPGPGWEEHFTDDGFMYYYNPKTGESKWAEA